MRDAVDSTSGQVRAIRTASPRTCCTVRAAAASPPNVDAVRLPAARRSRSRSRDLARRRAVGGRWSGPNSDDGRRRIGVCARACALRPALAPSGRILANARRRMPHRRRRRRPPPHRRAGPRRSSRPRADIDRRDGACRASANLRPAAASAVAAHRASSADPDDDAAPAPRPSSAAAPHPYAVPPSFVPQAPGGGAFPYLSRARRPALRGARPAIAGIADARLRSGRGTLGAAVADAGSATLRVGRTARRRPRAAGPPIVRLIGSRAAYDVDSGDFRRRRRSGTVVRSTRIRPRRRSRAARSSSLGGWGFGHGVGLCQWGAHGMAAARGRAREDIVAFYYPRDRARKRMTAVSSGRPARPPRDGSVPLRSCRTIASRSRSGRSARRRAPACASGMPRRIPPTRSSDTRLPRHRGDVSRRAMCSSSTRRASSARGCTARANRAAARSRCCCSNADRAASATTRPRGAGTF